MQRILRSTEATVTFTFYAGGDAVDLDADPTVRVLAEDGSELETGTGTATGTTGEYEYTLALASTAELDVLTVEWTGDLAGDTLTLEQRVEVVGGFLFTLARARRLSELADPTDPTDAELAQARTDAEDALDEACNVALVPRYGRAVLDGDGSDELFLPSPQAHRIISASVNGVALTAPELAEVVPVPDEGVLYREALWPKGRRNIEVRYAHGFTSPPGLAPEAALKLARYILVESPIDDRALSVTNPDGSVEVFTVAGRRGARFAVPEANALVKAVRHVLG